MFSFKLILGILFGFLVTGILVLGVISYQNNRASRETDLRVEHSHTVLENTNLISIYYKDVQLESDAYFTLLDTSRIAPYTQARNNLKPLLKSLKELTADNPLQTRAVTSMNTLVTEVISFNDSILYAKAKVYSSNQLRHRIEHNRELRQQIRKFADPLKAEETRLLKAREAEHEKHVTNFNRAFYGLLFLIAVMMAATFFAIRYNFNKRIKVQEDLKKANELFAKLFYESPIAIVISRLEDGVIIDCNHTYCEILNYTKEEVIGKDPISLKIIPDKSYRVKILNHDQEKTTIHETEFQLQPKDKDPIWVSASMQRMVIDGTPCLLSAILDMTAHKEAEVKMQKALNAEVELNKLKSNFVTLASHEFRTPLTTVLSSAFLMENYATGENKDKITKHIVRIKNATNSLTSILDEFLSLTKIEEGKLEPKPETINIRQLLETLCQDISTHAKHGQTITYRHAGEEDVYSDPVLIVNIITNLVSNAIKYSPEETQISVASDVNSKIHLTVKDQGIGISSEDQERLFERFFRASNSGNIQGTGLGLHILKHYVDMLHGSVDVKSTPGKGSEFKVTIEHSDLV